jgi:hypothetical protein
MQAMAFAPLASSRGDRSSTVADSAPAPTRSRPARNGAPATEISTVAAKGAPGKDTVITNAARISVASSSDSSWLRVMLLAPSASRAMSVTMLGDADLSVMRSYFVKPQMAIAMGFAEDPTPGLASDQFTGPAAVKLETKSFVMRAASLR